MLGALLAVLSAATFALNNASVRRGVLTGTVPTIDVSRSELATAPGDHRVISAALACGWLTHSSKAAADNARNIMTPPLRPAP